MQQAEIIGACVECGKEGAIHKYFKKCSDCVPFHSLGNALRIALNDKYGLNISRTQENNSDIESLVCDIIGSWDYGYCPDCDREREPPEWDEP